MVSGGELQRVSDASEMSPNSATAQPAECDVRMPLAIRRSSGTPTAGLVRSRVLPFVDPMSSLSGTVGTSFGIPTRARSLRRCGIAVHHDASRSACRDGTRRGGPWRKLRDRDRTTRQPGRATAAEMVEAAWPLFCRTTPRRMPHGDGRRHRASENPQTRHPRSPRAGLAQTRP